MVVATQVFADLPDETLVDTVKRLACDERHATAQLVAALTEFDTRRLYLGAGCASLFAYCTRILLLSEHAAYHRIEAARAARRFPVLLNELADGSMTLTTVTLLAPHLTPDNVDSVLEAARYRSKREVERQVAALAPQPDVPSSIRRHPAPAPLPALAAFSPLLDGPTTCTESCVPPRAPTRIATATATGGAERHRPTPATHVPTPPTPRPVVAPLSPDRFRVQITVSGATVETLRRVQDLMRHTVPDGDPAVILDRALRLLLEHLERRRLAAARRPRVPRAPTARSRHIPAAVRRAVWTHDEGRCTFVGHEGRCGERGFLEFHHLEPWALGGEATVAGMALRCRAHNVYEAELAFGLRPPPDVAREMPTRYGAC